MLIVPAACEMLVDVLVVVWTDLLDDSIGNSRRLIFLDIGSVCCISYPVMVRNSLDTCQSVPLALALK